MSALAPARPQPGRAAPATTPSRGRDARSAPLRVVRAAPSVAGRVPFAVLVALILGSGLVALLMLHTLAAQDAFKLRDLQHRTATLADAEQQLTVTDQQAQAPGALAARARALGLVPTGSLRFLRRADGTVVAVARAVAPVSPPAARTVPAKPAAGKQPVKPSGAKAATAHKSGTAATPHKSTKPTHRTTTH